MAYSPHPPFTATCKNEDTTRKNKCYTRRNKGTKLKTIFRVNWSFANQLPFCTFVENEYRKNDLILIMTPEKQDKTLELSKHWSVDSTPARNEVIMKRTYPLKSVQNLQ